jgi:hypothetical protein
MSPAAKFTRLMYQVVEELWNRLTPGQKQAWLQNVKVPELSGRDLWGRVNWHQVADYNEWHPSRDGLNPFAPVKGHLDGNVALPADILAMLGGPLVQRDEDLVPAARFTRGAYGTGATLAAAVAAAYAAVGAKGFTLTGLAATHYHTLSWHKSGPTYIATVDQCFIHFARPLALGCLVRDLALTVTFGSYVSSQQHGVEVAGANIPAALGPQTGTSAHGNVALEASSTVAMDNDGWSPLAPTGTQFTRSGYYAVSTRAAWKQRG